MEQGLTKIDSVKKIYKDRTIWAGTFLGGPLAAGYLIAENFKILNESEKVKNTWFISILCTIIIFGGVLLIPNIDKIPRQLIPLIYTAIAYYIVKYYQGAKIEEFLKTGGKAYSWWRALGIGLIGTVVTIVPIIGIIYVTDPTISATTKSYGKLKHEILFNKSNVSEKEADEIATGLINAGFFDETQPKSVFVKKVSSSFEISIPVIVNAWDNPEAISFFEQLRKDIQAQFSNNKIILNLCLDTDISQVKKKLE